MDRREALRTMGAGFGTLGSLTSSTLRARPVHLHRSRRIFLRKQSASFSCF